jgi:hypothetical protein
VNALLSSDIGELVMESVRKHFVISFFVIAAAQGHAADVSINVHADRVLGPVSPLLTGACIEDVNHEIYGGIYSQMLFGESFQEPAPSPPGQTEKPPEISRMWRSLRRGTAAGRFVIVSERPFAGRQSQQMSFDSGEGEWGIENQGLNRWGLNIVAGKIYEGYLWARAGNKTELVAALESSDGSQVYAQTRVVVGFHLDARRLRPRGSVRAKVDRARIRHPRPRVSPAG